jgi:hypothetical protein
MESSPVHDKRPLPRGIGWNQAALDTAAEVHAPRGIRQKAVCRTFEQKAILMVRL